MTRRFLASTVLAAALTVSLAACGTSDSEPSYLLPTDAVVTAQALGADYQLSDITAEEADNWVASVTLPTGPTTAQVYLKVSSPMAPESSGSAYGTVSGDMTNDPQAPVTVTYDLTVTDADGATTTVQGEGVQTTREGNVEGMLDPLNIGTSVYASALRLQSPETLLGTAGAALEGGPGVTYQTATSGSRSLLYITIPQVGSAALVTNDGKLEQMQISLDAVFIQMEQSVTYLPAAA